MTLRRYVPRYEEAEHQHFEFQFTVFVPVFNRASTLHRVFNSLNAQTFRDFEVIIINDGSTDDSDRILNNFLSKSSFETVYINNKVNKHKMGCILEAVKVARGEFFLIFDSDDECTPDALEVFFNEYNNIEASIKPMVSGVTCNCYNQNGDLIGDAFPEDAFYSNSFEKKVYHNIKGEKWGFNKTAILKGIEIDKDVFGRGLIPESYLWLLIAKEGFITKYINRNLRLYYTQSDDSLSSLGYDKKAFGMAIFAVSFINWFHKKHINKAFRHFLMRLYSLLKASNYLDFKFKDYIAAIDSYSLKVVFILAWPFRKLL